MICFGFMLYPISEHSFYLKAIKKLFIAKTSDESLFIKRKIKSKHQKIDFESVKTQELQHKQINISLKSSVRLYLQNYLSSWFGFQLYTPKGKLQKLYEQGQDKLEGEMNIVKIIRNLKFLRILMKKYVADEQMQFDIRHNPKNVIDLDAPSEQDEPENSNNSEVDQINTNRNAIAPSP